MLYSTYNMFERTYLMDIKFYMKEDGIFELRAQQGSDITRVLYFFQIGNKAYLTNGFTKKTQKTPPSEI